MLVDNSWWRWSNEWSPDQHLVDQLIDPGDTKNPGDHWIQRGMMVRMVAKIRIGYSLHLMVNCLVVEPRLCKIVANHQIMVKIKNA